MKYIYFCYSYLSFYTIN